MPELASAHRVRRRAPGWLWRSGPAPRGGAARARARLLPLAGRNRSGKAARFLSSSTDPRSQVSAGSFVRRETGIGSRACGCDFPIFDGVASASTLLARAATLEASKGRGPWVGRLQERAGRLAKPLGGRGGGIVAFSESRLLAPRALWAWVLPACLPPSHASVLEPRRRPAAGNPHRRARRGGEHPEGSGRFSPDGCRSSCSVAQPAPWRPPSGRGARRRRPPGARPGGRADRRGGPGPAAAAAGADRDLPQARRPLEGRCTAFSGLPLFSGLGAWDGSPCPPASWSWRRPPARSSAWLRSRSCTARRPVRALRDRQERHRSPEPSRRVPRRGRSRCGRPEGARRRHGRAPRRARARLALVESVTGD
jgi:hypothetical protein